MTIRDRKHALEPASASTEFLALLVHACRSSGLSPTHVLAQADLSADVLSNPSQRVPIHKVRDAWTALEQLSGQPTLGLALAAKLEPGAFDLLDYLVQSATTLREACELFCRFLPLLANAGSAWLTESGDRATLCHHADGAIPIISQLIVGGIVCRARSIVGPSLPLRSVGFAQSARGPEAEYARLLGVPVSFDQICDTVVFDRGALDLPTKRADPTLARILRRQADEAIRRVKAAGQTGDAALREVAVELVLSGHASLDRMAERLGTTSRTLQRRLAEAGLTHRSLIDSVRAELVDDALAQGSGNLSALARSLGYSTSCSLRRARERWQSRRVAVLPGTSHGRDSEAAS